MGNKVILKAIIDIAGKPESLVSKTLDKVLEKLEGDETLEVVDVIKAEPDLQDEQSGMYTAFLEVELEFLNIRYAMSFIVEYLPTSVEILEPSSIKVTNEQLTEVLNDMAHFQIKNLNENHKFKAHNHILQKQIKELEDKLKISNQ
ncbi:MAG: hypothetical protein LAT82_02305 [Nanoarchaeota archaeon]|nr:hypothetical protein [Nanoarchaeota archaeon]